MHDDLALAIQHHQAGRLERAVELYRRILTGDPEHADALHLWGVACVQTGNPARGVELIARAVAIKPSAAVFHCNLAEAYRALGRLDQAVRCCQTALRLQPVSRGKLRRILRTCQD